MRASSACRHEPIQEVGIAEKTMKNPPESRTRTDALPSFLDETTGPPPTPETAAPTDDQPAGPDVAVVPEAPPAPPEEQAGTEAAPVAEVPAAPPLAPRRTSAGRRTAPPATRVGMLTTAAGIILALVAVALAVPAAEAFTAPLLRLGLQPATALLLGAVLMGTGAVRRHLHALHASLHDVHGQNSSGTDALQEGIQFLVAAQEAHRDRPSAAGEDLDQVFLTLQRQDEKINNLTKAIKMYGKPLMEISGQSAELAAAITQVRTSVDTANETARQATARLETQLRSGAASKQDIAEVQESVFSLAAAVEAASRKPGEAMSLEPLQQQLVRIDVAVQALAQRLEDNEVRRSLLRLEDTAQKSRDEMQQLLRGESVERATAQLQRQLDTATAKLTDGLGQLRDGNLTGIESAVRDIQREVAGVATAVAQIQVSVKASAARPAAAVQASPTAPVAAATPAPAAAQAAPAPAPAAPQSTPATEAATGAAAYQTGTRSTNGKNVLGAIAKLKQMKT
jgi:hypothetical protein